MNEEVLRKLNPELDSAAAIRGWVQQLVDIHTEEMVSAAKTMGAENTRAMVRRMVERENALQHDMTVEGLYDVIAGEIDDVYANG